MARIGSSMLAWAGWRMRVPESWRPLRIEGEWRKGSIIVGDAAEAIMQVKWMRVTRKNFDAARWARRRLKKVRRAPAAGGPSPKGFPDPAWAPADPDAGRGAFWYGYAPAAGLLVGVLTSAGVSRKGQRAVASTALPALRASGRDDPTRWAVFGASFESPPGFAVRRRRVHLGDVALQLTAPGRSTLLLRQVYPAALALARRELPLWLEFPVFKEHRRFRPADVQEAWRVESFGRTLEGLRRQGRKQLPFPLGVCAPRWSEAAVVHDAELDRLLIVEYDAAGRADKDRVARAIGAMNWAHFEPGGKR